MTTYGTFDIDGVPAPSDFELTDCCQSIPETEAGKVELGDNLCYQEGTPPRRHVLLSRAGNPYIALDDDEALAFARLLEPVEALVDALRTEVARVKNKMDNGARPCPFCGHHYIHTDVNNIGKGDRWPGSSLCPFPMVKAALKAMEPPNADT